jgi:hypothetical protein
MKKATPQSIAAWSVCAAGLVGYQIAVQRWPLVAGWERLKVIVLIGVLYLAMKLMDDAPPRALFPSKLNSRRRNALNVANLVAGVAVAISLVYLSGLVGHPQVGSMLFWSAVGGTVAGTIFQLVFSLVTARSDPAPA